MRHALSPWFTGFEDRRNYWIYLFGRRKPGVTIAQAQAGLNAVYHPIINDVEAPLQQGMSPATLEKFKAKELTVEDGRRGQSSIHRIAKTPMTMLLAITAIVLLIACANIANLLLARGANRAMEMGVRLALGATRRQLLAQLLTESLRPRAHRRRREPGRRPVDARRHGGAPPAGRRRRPSPSRCSRRSSPSPAALSVLTGLFFGIFPALHNTRGDLVTAIRAGAGQIMGHRAAARFRSTLVTAQIALSMALLIAAGLFMRSLANVSRVNLGLRVDDVVAFGMSPDARGLRQRARAALLRARRRGAPRDARRRRRHVVARAAAAG